MRLAVKLTLILMIGTGLVLGVQAWLHVQRISQLQEQEIRDDFAMLARSLGVSVSELWGVAGRERALEFVREADAKYTRTRIRFLAEPGTSAVTAEARSGSTQPDGVQVDRIDDPDSWGLRATVPVQVGSVRVGALKLAHSLTGERAYFLSFLWTQLYTSLAALLVCAVVALGAGALLIAKPIFRLVEQARRVAKGDFTQHNELDQRDEIGALAKELNAMTDKLAEAQASVVSERRARTGALEQLRHADRLSTVGRLASSIAHEMGTPLNVVAGRAALITADTRLPEAARNNASIIAAQAERLTETLRELLQFSRHKTLDKRDTDVSELIAHTLSLMEPMAENKGVTLVLGALEAGVARLDQGKILQVLTNLITNAIDAMPKGGQVELSVRREQIDQPPDRQAAPGSFIAFRVQDEGVGIPEDRLSNIFKPFFTTKKQTEGTGLGLSVSYGIVREHGGWMEVESTLGQGSCFAVYLPEGKV